MNINCIYSYVILLSCFILSGCSGFMDVVNINIEHIACKSYNEGNAYVTYDPLVVNLNKSHTWKKDNKTVSTNQNLQNVNSGKYNYKVDFFNTQGYKSGYYYEDIEINHEIEVLDSYTSLVTPYQSSISKNVLPSYDEGYIDFKLIDQVSGYSNLIIGFIPSSIEDASSLTSADFVYGIGIMRSSNSVFIWEVNCGAPCAGNSVWWNLFIREKFKIVKTDTSFETLIGDVEHSIPLLNLQLPQNPENYRIGVITSASSIFESIMASFRCPANPGFAPTEDIYATPKKDITGRLYVAREKFEFKFDEEYYRINGDDLSYKLYNADRDLQSGIQLIGSADIKYGDNRYVLDTDNFSNGNLYLLELSNKKNEKWYLKFRKEQSIQ